MRENGGDIRFACLEAQILVKKQSSSKYFLLRS